MNALQSRGRVWRHRSLRPKSRKIAEPMHGAPCGMVSHSCRALLRKRITRQFSTKGAYSFFLLCALHDAAANSRSLSAKGKQQGQGASVSVGQAAVRQIRDEKKPVSPRCVLTGFSGLALERSGSGVISLLHLRVRLLVHCRGHHFGC